MTAMQEAILLHYMIAATAQPRCINWCAEDMVGSALLWDEEVGNYF